MTPKVDLVNVRISVNGKEQTIKMEKGTSFENKGGIFMAGENNGVLKMTNYQFQTFKAMANNYTEDGENGIVLSKKDIQEAQNKYKNGGFVADLTEFLPEGYRIERPKLTSAENMVQAYVTNGNESQSATLKFRIQEIAEIKAASETHHTQNVAINNKANVVVSLNDKDAEIETLEEYGESTNQAYVYGYMAYKDNVCSCYDKNKNLVGTIEELSDEKRKYMDKDGNCLYYEKFKSLTKGINEEHQYIYDSNNRLKFIVKYDFNDQRTASSMQGMTYEEYDINGNVIKTGKANHFPAGTNVFDLFQPLEKKDIIGNVYYSIGSLFIG